MEERWTSSEAEKGEAREATATANAQVAEMGVVADRLRKELSVAEAARTTSQATVVELNHQVRGVWMGGLVGDCFTFSIQHLHLTLDLSSP